MGTTIDARFPTDSLPKARPLLGRNGELQQAHGRLKDNVRLLTILGPPGVGKSHFAAALAHHCLSNQTFSAVEWVDCTHATSPEEVVHCFAKAATQSDAPLATDSESALLPHLLQEQEQTLWILNNFDRAATSTNHSVSHWLSQATEATFVVTSRRRLEIREEHCLELGPLDLDAALQLLLDRARRIAPDWAQSKAHRDAAARISTHLDCIPLALELAAGRARLLSSPELYQRLKIDLTVLRSNRSDLPARHRTLDAAIQWSWSLLNDHEKEVMTAASAFANGFNLHNLEDALRHQPDIDVLHTVAALRDHSLLLHQSADPDRPYKVLTLIREFVDRQIAHEEEPVLLEIPALHLSDAAQVAQNGSWLRLPGEPRIHIERPLLQKLLRAVAQQRIDHPGSALAAEALIQVGWPDESILPRSARNRLYAAIHALRSAGLGDLLLTRNDGYLLDLRVPLTWASPTDGDPEADNTLPDSE